MHVDDLDYSHPPELVAQTPCEPRDAARLLHIAAEAGSRQDLQVRDLRQILQPNDLLVLNTTKVIPARLKGHKDSGGQIEVLLIHPIEGISRAEGECWNCMVRGKVRPGTQLLLEPELSATVEEVGADAQRRLRFSPGVDVLAHAMQHGAIPLPPYIRRDADDNDEQRYQTVFAQQPGSVAAPTASLHFTPELLDDLSAMGVKRAHVELRVGTGHL